MSKNYENISDRIRIYVDSKNKDFDIVDMKKDISIFL